MARSKENDLSVGLELRIDKLEKSLARANQLAERGLGQMEKRSREAAARMEKDMAKAADGIGAKFANLGKGAFAGLAGSLAAFSVGGTVQAFRQVASSVAMIGNEAKRAGLSTKAFQELSYVATQTRVPVDALIDGMKELGLRADEYIITGSGSAAESFKRLGYTADDLKKKLADPTALFTEIIDKVQGLNEAARNRVFDELFGGTGGERFVEIIDKGGEGIRRMIKEANDLGIIMDDKMIAKADEVDRKFNLIATVVGSKLKGAIVEATEALSEFLDQFRSVQDQGANTLRRNIAVNFQDQAAKRYEIDDLREQQRNFPPNMQQANESEIRVREAELAKLEGEYRDLQAALDKYTGMTSSAANSVSRLGGAADAAAVELHPRQPEKGNLEPLNRYNDAVAREVAKKGMLDLIGHTEGTDKGRGYNETLGYGKFTGGDVNLTAMTLKEVQALQRQMLAHPDNKFNSSAVGRYQIVGKTMKGLMGEMGLSGDELFSPALQDRMAQQLLRRRGSDLAGLRSEWTSLQNVPDGAIQTGLGVSQQTMPGRDEGVQTAIDKRKELSAAYQEIVGSSVEFIAQQNLEGSTLGMTAQQAAKLRYEQGLLNEAYRAGITLTPEQRAELSQLAAGMAEVEVATAKAAETQEHMREVQSFLAEGASGFFSSIITGSASAQQALQRLLSSLADAALQAAFLGQGPLGKLFGGGAGIFGTLVGGLFGGASISAGTTAAISAGAVGAFASGGHVRGPGTGTSDSVLARLSNGEFVVNAQSTAKHRALLEAVNSGNIPAFATGGLVGRAASGGSSSMASQTVNIAPVITVNAAQGGDSKANDEAARKTAAAIDAQMRATIQQELQRAMRPGGVFRNGR
ncbi:phage tail tape measure protein [Aureimonas psammosilenae]|uniref:phage tail tape measure protein n=1 Tax=Aureimonas psammosilenae TaxID=2495496 RepID=UPI0012606722|nr:phage tail tape measure protein [Aureimonas psammosilenae]